MNQQQQLSQITDQIGALIRTTLMDNKPIDKNAIRTYLNTIADMPEVSDEEVDRAVLSLFQQFEQRLGQDLLHTLEFSQAFAFSSMIYGVYDGDYSFVALRRWASGTLCYALYSLTCDESLPPNIIYICQRPESLLEKLRSLHLCPDNWTPLSPARGETLIKLSLSEVEKLLSNKVALLKEGGPLNVL